MRRRLDQVLEARGLAASRSRARDLIRRGQVTLGDAVVSKPGLLVAEDAPLAVRAGSGAEHVSRGALKLETGLDAFGFDAQRAIALDIGASTGGFTEVLLNRGARRVYSIDIGHGQLHERLRADGRVVAIEGCDARSLTADLIGEPVTAVVADVSFISLTKALPAAMVLPERQAWLVALVKPQFEVGPDGVGRGGIVREAELRERAVADVAAWVAAQPGWRVVSVVASPITGGSGNEEYLLGARRDA